MKKIGLLLLCISLIEGGLLASEKSAFFGQKVPCENPSKTNSQYAYTAANIVGIGLAIHWVRNITFRRYHPNQVYHMNQGIPVGKPMRYRLDTGSKIAVAALESAPSYGCLCSLHR